LTDKNKSQDSVRKLKIVLSTWGSTGDVQPFLALSTQLMKAGHEARVCTSAIYRERFEKRGVELYPVGVPFDRARMDWAMDEIVKIKDPFKSAVFVAREGILYKADKWHHDCLAGMEGYDLAVCHSADIAGQEAAIRLNLPWISVSYCPGYIKSDYEAPTPAPNLGPSVNRRVWKLVEWLMQKKVDPMFNDFIASIGGRPRRLIGVEGMYSPELNLIAASPSIAPPPPDLPERHKFTGAWFLDEPDDQPPPELQAFLNQGEPPVIISFGSMGGSKSRETTQILVEAAQRAGQRAIIQAGWGNLGMSHPPEGVCFVGYVPHNLLFRRGRCVIHHGGAGTTAAACRAGVPSIVAPHLADQSYWAAKLQKLGVAPKPVHRQNLTVKRLAKRIEQVVSSEPMAERAKALGRKVDAEDGLANAVNLIEAFAKDKGLFG
jgi:UDP:flavonoid glycosyltransferase YjiC (YdhE family)